MATLSELVVKISADIGDLQRKMTPAQRAVNQLGQSAQDVGRTLTVGLTLPIVALGAAAVASAAELDSLTRGLTAVSGSAEATRDQLTRLQDAARLPGLGFREAIRGSIALQAAGLSAALAERSLVAFGNALATVGRGKADLDGVILALSQIASKGKISAEEINQLAERVPQVRQAMIAAFGSADTERLGKAGITATDFIVRLTAQLETLPKVTGGVANSFENLSDAWFRARAAIGEQLLPAVIPLVEGLANLLAQVRTINPETVRWGIAVGATAAAVGPLLIAVGGLAVALPTVTATVTALATALGVGILPLVAAGGPLLIGIAALSALLVKQKLDALAAAGALATYRGELVALSNAELHKRAGDLQDELSVLRGQRDREFRRATLVDPTFTGDLGQIDVRIREAEARLAAVRREQSSIARHALPRPVIEPPKINIPTGNTIRDATEELGKFGDALKEIFDVAKRLERLTIGRNLTPTIPRFDESLGVGEIFLGKSRADQGAITAKINRELDELGKRSEAAARPVRDMQTSLQDLQRAFSALPGPMGGALSALTSFASSLDVIKASRAQGGVGGAMGIIAGLGGTFGAVVEFGRAIFGRNAEWKRALQQNTETLERLRVDLSGFRLTFGAQGQLAGVASQLSGREGDILNRGGGFLGRATVERQQKYLEQLAQRFGGTLFQLNAAAERLGIDLYDSKGRLIKGALDQLAEALRLSALQVQNFAKTLDGQWKLLSARAEIFDVTDPAALAQVELQKLLAGLSEAAEVQFGLVGLDLSSATGQAALEEGLRELFEAFEAGTLSSSMLTGFESVDQFLQALLGTDSALDRLAETANKLSASLVNVPGGYRLALRVWEAQDARGWTPPTGAGPTDTGGALPQQVTFNIARIDASTRPINEVIDELIEAVERGGRAGSAAAMKLRLALGIPANMSGV